MFQMMEFKNKKLIKINESNLKESEIYERYDLQAAIVNSWTEFCNEINMPQLSLIGSEICPHNSVQNAIDILAFDTLDNVPVIIELKRDKNKLQLLQAITYAAMVATWNKENFLQIASLQKHTQVEDLEDEIEGIENESRVKIILIAEKFDPEVMISSDWLYSNYKIDITTFTLKVFSKDQQILFNFSQTYPLPELKDAYEMRNKKRAFTSDTTSWDEIRANLKYDWGASILDVFLKLSPGDTSRKRFPPLVGFREIISFDKISASFREKWVLVYLWGKPEDAQATLENAFGKDADIGEWRDGYSVKLYSKSDADNLLKWLQVKPGKKAA